MEKTFEAWAVGFKFFSGETSESLKKENIFCAVGMISTALKLIRKKKTGFNCTIMGFL